MAVSVHSTIRLDADLDVNGLPINEYRVIFQGHEDTNVPAISSERSLTGKMHVHRLLDGGDPKVFPGVRYELFLTRAEKDQILQDLGKDVYFMPHVRDEAVPEDHRNVMLFGSVEGLHPIDPMANYWSMVIMLEESTGNTPG